MLPGVLFWLLYCLERASGTTFYTAQGTQLTWSRWGFVIDSWDFLHSHPLSACLEYFTRWYDRYLLPIYYLSIYLSIYHVSFPSPCTSLSPSPLLVLTVSPKTPLSFKLFTLTPFPDHTPHWILLPFVLSPLVQVQFHLVFHCGDRRGFIFMGVENKIKEGKTSTRQ